MTGWQYRGGDMVGLKELADDEIRLAGPIQSDSIVDGPGLRGGGLVSGLLPRMPRLS